MNTEELIKRCRAIRLSEEEEGRVCFKSKMKENGAKIVAGCLMRKIIYNGEVHVAGLRLAMKKARRTAREVKIESLGDNIFMFKFENDADKRRVLAGGPWHFNRALIVLIESSGMGDAKKQDFSHASFWVQIHKLPIMCMNKETVKALGESVGKVEEVETDSSGECIGKFVRLRISVDITKPLKKIMVMTQNDVDDEDEDKEEISMLLVYEKLPDFYFCCGRMGHQYRECVHYKSQSKHELACGPWANAIAKAEKSRQSKGRERWNSEASTMHTNIPTQARAVSKLEASLQNQQNPDNPGIKDGST